MAVFEFVILSLTAIVSAWHVWVPRNSMPKKIKVNYHNRKTFMNKRQLQKVISTKTRVSPPKCTFQVLALFRASSEKMQKLCYVFICS